MLSNLPCDQSMCEAKEGGKLMQRIFVGKVFPSKWNEMRCFERPGGKRKVSHVVIEAKLTWPLMTSIHNMFNADYQLGNINKQFVFCRIEPRTGEREIEKSLSFILWLLRFLHTLEFTIS